MFDKLVESTRQKSTGRSKFFLVTSLIYGAALTTLLVLTIMWFDPVPAEAFNSAIMLAPPPVPQAPPQNLPKPVVVAKPAPDFATPAIPDHIADAKTVTPKPKVVTAQIYDVGVAGGKYSPNAGLGLIANLNTDNSEPPPPPMVKPTPKVEPTPAPTPEIPKLLNLSTGVITGKAISRIQPPYPQMAKAIRAQGTVQVQITISEAGRVLDASVLSGHPTLRDAARQAALQWVFTPTALSGKPVKVMGVISFNFTLN